MSGMSDAASLQLYCSPETKGKCFTCGFLHSRVVIQSKSSYEEIELPKRYGLESLLEPITISDGKSVQPILECVVGYRNVQGNIGEEAANQQGNFEKAARIVLEQDIKCPKWQAYEQGKSIQQYYMEDSLQRLEELRQKF